MVGFSTWRKALGAQRDAIGRTVDMNGRTYTIVGVMPADGSWRLGADVFVPATPAERLAWPLVIGRLRPGLTTDQARDQLRRDIDPVLTSIFGDGRRPFRTTFGDVARLPETMTDLHKMLLLASGLIVLIACANLASLMLARGVRRGREYALRFALGARRSSIVRQTLIEALICALLAGTLGVVLASWLFDILTYSLTSDVPAFGGVSVSLNWRVFALASLASIAAALLFGLYPALRVSSSRLRHPLNDAGATATHRSRIRYSPLAIAQLALTLALLMGSNLLVRSARELGDREIGFEPRGLFSINAFASSSQRDSIDLRVVRASLMSALAREPGVRSVATVRHAPPAGYGVSVTLASGGSRRAYLPSYQDVSANFLTTLGVRVVEGRDFATGDEVTQVGAAVVSRAAARSFWRGESPVGQMLTLADQGRAGPLVRVVGVVEDVAPMIAAAPDIEPSPAVYIVTRDSTPRLETMLARASVAEEQGMQTRLIRRARGALPPGGVVRVVPFLASLNAELAIRYFIAGVFTALGFLALGLALFGVFSVRAHDVAHRSREFAVRISLGATRSQIARSVLRDSMVIVLAGTGLGAFLAMYAGRRLDQWLYGVFYTDVWALIVAELVLLATTILASLAPALRAARSNPVDILRAS